MGGANKNHHHHHQPQQPRLSHHRRKPSSTSSSSSMRCGALCCSGSRLSVSSSEDSHNSESCRIDPMTNQLHAMVQARLEKMIRGKGRRELSNCVMLVALDKSSYDPKEDFRESMLDVITSKGLEQPKELRSLLNCYLSINARENRLIVLEAFHEVCVALFDPCKC